MKRNRKVYPAGNRRWVGTFFLVVGMLGLSAHQAKANSLTFTDPNKITVTFVETTLVKAVEIQCEPNDVNTNFSVSYGTPGVWSVGPIVTREPSPGVLKYYIKYTRSSAIASDTFITRIKSPSDANTRGTRGMYNTINSSDTIISNNSGPTFLRGRRTDIPALFKLDFNKATDNNDTNSQPGFTRFIDTNSGGEDVNGQAGVVVELSGNIDSLYRSDPNNKNDPCDPTFDPNRQPILFTKLYRDFIYGVGIPPGGVTMTVWGLGANRDCNVVIYSFDSARTSTRRADWRANGKYLFTTDFAGDDPCNWPRKEDTYAWPGTAKADSLGRIILTSSIGSGSPANDFFAFVNGLMVYTTGTYAEPKYAQVQRPAAGKEGVPADTLLKWRKGADVAKHDLYFGTTFNDVNTATRASHPGVLIYAPDLGADANIYDPWSAVGLLKLYQTYYWRVDENDTSNNLWKGEVWSFKTSPYFVVEDFNSYENGSALRSVWKDGGTNGTSAEVFVETAIVRGGNSMRYWYRNNLSPYYSEVDANMTDLGIGDTNWLGIGAQALTLRFYGLPNNPTGEQMYVRLTDGDSPAKTATVMYGNMNNVRLKQWNKWSIPLTAFTGVNLAKVAKITIGFGDVGSGNAGTVYFEDILLDSNALPYVAGEVNVNTVYQQLEGFGAAACYDTEALTGFQNREEIYDLLFRDLGLDLLRIKNTYQINSNEITATGQIVAAARQPTRNPNLKLFLVPWSPAANLKSDGYVGGPGHYNGTLKKDASDPNWPPYYYVYDQYATWWLNSLIGPGGFNSVGVYPDYISIQNEPDWGQQDQECRFDSTENSTYAGYDKAFEAVYNKLNGNVSPMPKILAPESMGFGGSSTYINALNARGQINHVYGFSHHLYSDGSYNDPDGMISGMTNYHNSYGYKPLFQTEYDALQDPPTFAQAVLQAQHMHNCLVYEGLTSYYAWSLFRNGSYTGGGMINLGTGSSGYTIRDLYWFFKHYSRFTDPNWYRVYATPSPSGDLRMTAFKSPDGNELTIVVLNKSTSSTNLTLTLNGFLPGSSEVYRSTSELHWSYIGSFDPSISLPGQSITTIHMTRLASPVLPDCDAVLAAGYGLTSDIDGDCYVNYRDLKIITDNWLRVDCSPPSNCGGADFEPDGKVNFADFSTFAEQWLWCNNPADPNCELNW